MPIAFRARARTIDHLGREQIADCPTAISELWKNAYDAYAREVALHIFDGEVPIAAVVDNGHGMDLDEFIDKWLVIGTDAKLSADTVPEEDRNGLQPRVRQGKKGIGRLSVGYLGPVCLVLSKRKHKPYVAALIDWRLFENPYLILDDVLIPLEEFTAREQLDGVVKKLFDDLIDNVWVKAEGSERKARVEDAWKRWDTHFPDDRIPSSRQIAEIALSVSLEQRHFDVFPVLRGDAECGTALYVLGLNHELAVWVNPDAVEEDAEINQTRERLKQTLSGFVDPFAQEQGTPEFTYRVEVHREGREQIIITDSEVFGREDFLALEQYVEGSFDRYGTFQGRVRAFGREPFPVELPPQRLPPQSGAGYVGPFDLCIGTFEMDPKSTSHTPEQHQYFRDKAERFGGLSVYRSELRVMPYGRPDADYFGMEERRSRHAGREYWAHRRSFGRLAIAHETNPNLRDKAGREGLIDNKALRELRLLVIGVLQQTARRYFGSDATLRKELLPEIEAKNKLEQDARDAVKRRKKEFRAALRNQAPDLETALELVTRRERELIDLLDTGDAPEDVMHEMGLQLEQAVGKLVELRLPHKPARLGSTEAAYRSYRDKYEKLRETLARARTRWAEWKEKHNPRAPVEQARRAMSQHQTFLIRYIIEYEKRIGKLLEAETKRIDKQASEDRRRYFQSTARIIEDVEQQRMSLATALSYLEEEKDKIYEDVKTRYGGYIEALEQLAEGIDLSGAAVWSEEQREETEQKMEQVYALAQLGITVEIIGHELNELDIEIDRNLRRLPVEVQKLAPYRAAFQAHQSLMERLHFLAPLRLAGQRLKERIRGRDIHEYLRDFFHIRFEQRKVSFEATEAFLGFSVIEYSHRVYPVFVNLINNALYWLTMVGERRILLDRIDDDIIVADSGPGVDKDDIPRLFELFFTRRTDGRGVGLYLSRINLRAGGHDIEYVQDDARKVLPGANFAIRFEGIDHE
jgi:signal transduction histidine kinase